MYTFKVEQQPQAHTKVVILSTKMKLFLGAGTHVGLWLDSMFLKVFSNLK